MKTIVAAIFGASAAATILYELLGLFLPNAENMTGFWAVLTTFVGYLLFVGLTFCVLSVILSIFQKLSVGASKFSSALLGALICGVAAVLVFVGVDFSVPPEIYAQLVIWVGAPAVLGGAILGWAMLRKSPLVADAND